MASSLARYRYPRVHEQRDFTGGLNLRSDGMLLAPNESPDLINVDIDPRGGFRQRQGVQRFASTTFGAPLRSLYEYTTTSGTQQILAHDGTKLWKSTGGDFSQFGTRGGIARVGVFNDKPFTDTPRAYIVGNGAATQKWDGTTLSTLGTAWCEDIATPTTGNMPLGKCIASHMGHMFVANTRFNSVDRPNRIQYSHANHPEAWRSFDFVDIDTGADGDHITALVPWTDHLLIFKQRAVYALYGDSPTTFSVRPISREMGAISQEAVKATDLGVFFFNWPDGMYRYESGTPTYVFEKLRPALLDGSIPHAAQAEIQVGWGNRRLWVSVPWRGSTARARSFVLDPQVGDAWTAYDLPVGPFLEFRPPGANALFLAGDCTRSAIHQLDVAASFDTFATGVNTPITSRFRTSWVDCGMPGYIKRFLRPSIVMKAGSTANVLVNVHWDYDPTQAKRTFSLSTTAPPADVAAPTQATEGTGDATAGWGVSQWGAASWAASSGGSFSGGGGGGLAASGLGILGNERHQGRQLGTARSVALEFRGPATLQPWGVDSIEYTFLPRMPRG